MKAPSKSKRPKARDDEGMAVKRGNNAAKRRAKEAAMDKKSKKVDKKAGGGRCRGMGAATKGGKFSRGG